MPKPLEKKYEALAARRKGLEIELRLDASGDARRARVERISESFYNDESSPADELAFDRRARQLELDGIDDVITRIVNEMIGDSRIRVEERPPTAAELLDVIAAAHQRHERSREATARATAGKRAYEAALEIYNQTRAKLIQEGVEPALASEQAKASLTEQQQLDIYPPGSTMDFRGGRNLGDITIGATA